MNFVAIVTVAILVVLHLSGIQGTTNYCSASLCGKSKHIACNNKGGLAAACASNAKIITVTPAIRQAILNKHNQLRNKVAQGNFSVFKPAVRMATMVWNNELATLAAFNVKQCAMKHDACRNTNAFKFAGQNLAYTAWSGSTRTAQSVAVSHIQSWFSEQKDTTMANINKYSDPKNGKVIGHFTQVIQAKATHVGCAILRQTKGGFTYQYFACNYAYTNILNKPVYVVGKAASKCTTGTNPNFKFLCSIREKFAVNVA